MPVLEKRTEEKYSVKIIGDSLSPEYPKDTVFTLSRSLPVTSGKIGMICFLYPDPFSKRLIRVNTLGMLYLNRDKIIIHRFNPSYKDIIVPRKHVLYIHKAVESIITISKRYI